VKFIFADSINGLSATVFCVTRKTVHAATSVPAAGRPGLTIVPFMPWHRAPRCQGPKAGDEVLRRLTASPTTSPPQLGSLGERCKLPKSFLGYMYFNAHKTYLNDPRPKFRSPVMGISKRRWPPVEKCDITNRPLTENKISNHFEHPKCKSRYREKAVTPVFGFIHPTSEVRPYWPQRYWPQQDNIGHSQKPYRPHEKSASATDHIGHTVLAIKHMTCLLRFVFVNYTLVTLYISVLHSIYIFLLCH